jgi:hypothetical protein
MIIFSVSVLSIFRLDFPTWLPFYLILLLPLGSMFFIILSIYPRFSPSPGFPFYVRSIISPNDFAAMPEDDGEILNAYRKDCACLAVILYRKVLLFRIAMAFCFLYFSVLLILAIAGARNPTPSNISLRDVLPGASVVAAAPVSN